VKHVHIELSWTNLLSQPIVVTLSGVYLFCTSTQYASYEQFLEKQEELKQKALRLAFFSDNLRANSSSDGFFESLKSKIVKNIQFRLENVHLRLEQPLRATNQIAAYCDTV
jgi:hypothetical protein